MGVFYSVSEENPQVCFTCHSKSVCLESGPYGECKDCRAKFLCIVCRKNPRIYLTMKGRGSVLCLQCTRLFDMNRDV